MNKLIYATLAAALVLGSISNEHAAAQRFVPQKDKLFSKVKYEDSLVSLNDRCAVKKNPLSSHVRPVYVNHEPVGFCCTGCPIVFSRDPERYLKDFKVELADPVEPDHKAVLDSTTRTYLGQDVFFFADEGSRKKFLKHPLKFCGIIGDPVSNARFQPTKESPHTEYQGRQYYFQSDSTLHAFQIAPDRFWSRR